MKVLVCGAAGFVGTHVTRALELAGHEVVAGVSRRRHEGDLPIDFVRDTEPSSWTDRLRGIGAVVNAVGLLRDSARRPMQQVHADAPMALFEACARAGVRRVVQISALGIENGGSPYARTKREADACLLALTEAGRLNGVVVRPSIVFGRGGQSSEMFLALARLPVLTLPRAALSTLVQPVHVLELAEAIARLVGPAGDEVGLLDCVGPAPLTLADFVASLRTQLGRGGQRALALPEALTRLSARVGDAVPVSPWGSQALALLAQDSIGSTRALARLLGREPTPASMLLGSTTPD